MWGVHTVFEKSAAVLPKRSAWREALGCILSGIGAFLALALITHTTQDYLPDGAVRGAGLQNLAGPVGAFLAQDLLGFIGMIALAIPTLISVWGVGMIFGIVVIPSFSSVLGIGFTICAAAVWAEIELPRLGVTMPPFGYGGRLGHNCAAPLMAHLGFGGAFIFMTVTLLVSLVLSGNMTMERMPTHFGYLFYRSSKYLRASWERSHLLADLWHWTRSLLFTDEIDADKPGAKIEATKVEAGKASSLRAGAVENAKPSKAVPVAEPHVDALSGMEIDYRGPAHGKPQSKMFARSVAAPDRGTDWQVAATILTQQLEEFQVSGKITEVIEGPVVTTFEFEPAPGTKISKIAALEEDLARLLRAKSLRILAPIPGKNVVGFEVPNAERRMIGFADLMDSEDFREKRRNLPVAMGVDIFGRPAIEDLAEMPHLLVAGSTGSGKSVFMNTLIASLISRHSAKDLRLILIDPKMVEMAAYAKLPHLACPVVTDAAQEAKLRLDGLVVEMEERYRRMRAVGAKNITSFNEIVKSQNKSDFRDYEGKWQPMPYVVLIIDELADMMMVLGKLAEVPITRLAQKARAAGIHLVIATQRPSADVVTGLIKANFPTRVAFRVLSGIDSRTILDVAGAEKLLGKGDMLYLAANGTRRMHGAYLSEKEVGDMVKACR